MSARGLLWIHTARQNVYLLRRFLPVSKNVNFSPHKRMRDVCVLFQTHVHGSTTNPLFAAQMRPDECDMSLSVSFLVNKTSLQLEAFPHWRNSNPKVLLDHVWQTDRQSAAYGSRGSE